MRASLTAVTWITGFSFAFLAYEFVPLGFRDKWLIPIVPAVLLVLTQVQEVMVFRRFINPGMLLLLGWALASAAWAPLPTFVITQSIAMIGVSVIALAFCLAGWHPYRFERVMMGTIAVILIASIFVATAFPDIGVHSGTDVSLRDSWRGVTWQKNALGQLSAVGMILSVYLYAAHRTRAFVALTGFVICTFVLLKSRSSTSLMLALIASGTTLAIMRPFSFTPPQVRRVVLMATMILVPLLIYLAVATPYLGFIGQYFGKDGTFSGRTQIWNAMILEIKTRPWLGTGLTSFWGGMNAGEWRVQAAANWPVRNGHNGYIDVANELGLIGLFFFLSFMIWYCISLARLSRISRRHYGLHMPLFLYLVLANTSESGWMFPVAPTHLIGMFASLEVSRLLYEHAKLMRVARQRGVSNQAVNRDVARGERGNPSGI